MSTRYFIKRHPFFIGRFEIRETLDQVEPSFISTRKMISLVNTVVIEDSFGVDLAQLRSKFLTLLPSFIVSLCDGTKFELNRLLLSNEDVRYEIVGEDWSDVEISGNFEASDYSFIRNGITFAKVSKSDKSSYLLEFEHSDSVQLPFVLASMIGITMIGYDISH
ncbi:MAG: hypothetical protein ACOYL3_18610 [Desulfuromonadaceae bacterium]